MWQLIGGSCHMCHFIFALLIVERIFCVVTLFYRVGTLEMLVFIKWAKVPCILRNHSNLVVNKSLFF